MRLEMPVRLFIACLLFSSAAAVAAADAGPFTVTVLPFPAADASVESVTSGRRDREFTAFDYRATRQRGGPFWLRLVPQAGVDEPAGAALAVRKGRQFDVRAYDSGAGAGQPLTLAAVLPEYRAEQTALYVLPPGRRPGDAIYMRVDASGVGAERLDFSLSPLADAIARGRAQTRMVAAAFGALLAMSVTALLICIIMPASIFVWYATLFTLQALYIVYISGQGFDWPGLPAAAPPPSPAWNAPAAPPGAAPCLFLRRSTGMRRP